MPSNSYLILQACIRLSSQSRIMFIHQHSWNEGCQIMLALPPHTRTVLDCFRGPPKEDQTVPASQFMQKPLTNSNSALGPDAICPALMSTATGNGACGCGRLHSCLAEGRSLPEDEDDGRVRPTAMNYRAKLTIHHEKKRDE